MVAATDKGVTGTYMQGLLPRPHRIVLLLAAEVIHKRAAKLTDMGPTSAFAVEIRLQLAECSLFCPKICRPHSTS